MKIVYHPRYEEVYDSDPAADPGRMEAIVREIAPHYEFVTPESASEADIELVHTMDHMRDILRTGQTYEMALLAAGGAIRAADLAIHGDPSFALIRPPGHHASAGRCWGFCFFNNVAIAVAKLRKDGHIETAAILDIDLHFGDGTDNIFRDVPAVTYFHAARTDRRSCLESVQDFLSTAKAEVIAVSAGFDRHEDDWGRMLKTEDYETIGEMVMEFSESTCGGRRFGVLEGGYNHDVLGQNVRAFLNGME